MSHNEAQEYDMSDIRLSTYFWGLDFDLWFAGLTRKPAPVLHTQQAQLAASSPPERGKKKSIGAIMFHQNEPRHMCCRNAIRQTTCPLPHGSTRHRTILSHTSLFLFMTTARAERLSESASMVGVCSVQCIRQPAGVKTCIKT